MILKSRLIEFTRSHEKFAEYTYECGATCFIEHKQDMDFTDNKFETFIHSYQFKDSYLNSDDFYYYPYFVLSITDKAYLMYEMYETEEKVFIWVCYTEPKYRNNSYMAKLLKHLKVMFPNKTVIMDTFNQSLQNSSSKIGIELFKR